MNEKIGIYLKGILMGICDLIPGISGGTIAFITGIYERLIKAIHNISAKNYIKLLVSIGNKEKFLKQFKKLDLLFLIILFAGVWTAILSGASIISLLLETQKAYLLAFFLGLIIASSKIIYDDIDIHSNRNLIFAFFGIIIGIIVFFQNENLIIDNPTFFYIVLAGFMAIFALFLPGISGSFILLIMGVYEYMINLIHNLRHEYINLIPFMIGAGIGVLVISRIVTYLFKKDKSKTLYFILGLVIGTLLVPIRTIINEIQIFSSLIIAKLIILLVLGILSVYIIKKIE